jgi:hypothetical protein
MGTRSFRVPIRVQRSRWFREHARTFTSASFSLITGSGASSNRSLSTPPGSWNLMAFKTIFAQSVKPVLSHFLPFAPTYPYLDQERALWLPHQGIVVALSSQAADADKIASDLKGNTLRVYWYVLNASGKVVGVREVQRALGFSSPTLALYHLDKLKDLGLVGKESGEYRLVKEVKVDVLKQFMRVGKVFVPRFALYACLFTALTIYYALQLPYWDLTALLGLLFGGGGSAIFWFESVKTWRQRP